MHIKIDLLIPRNNNDFTTDDPKSCGVIKIDNSVIQEFHGQNPPSTIANGAVYIIEASVISYMERLKKVKVDFSVDVLPYYMGRIFTYYNASTIVILAILDRTNWK